MSLLEVQFRMHYKIADQENGPWTTERLARLCKMVNMTPREVAIFLRISPSALKRWLGPDKMPPAGRLLLDLFERTCQRQFLGTQYDTPLFPALQHD